MLQALSLFYNTVFAYPIVNLLALYHYLFALAKVPGTLGFSIVALTVTIRLLLHPFFKQQMHFFVADTTKIIVSLNKTLYFPFLHFKTLDVWFLGINLAASPKQMGSLFAYLIPIVTGILQYFQTVSTTAGMMPPPSTAIESKKDGKKEDSSADDFQKAMNTQMKYVFPFMIGWFALSMPAGLALYWNIFSVFSIIQYELHKKSTESSKQKAKS